MRATWAAAFLGVLLPCSGLAAVVPTKVFRIAGVAISARDGSPVPYCRLTVRAVVEAPEGGGRGFGRGNFAPDLGAELAMELGANFDGNGREGGQAGPRRGTQAEPEIATTADAQGHFTLTVPHGGAWRLAGTARGYRTQLFDQHDGSYYAQIVLSDAAPTYTLNFRMDRNAVIAGTVYDEAGEPVRQARIQAELIPVKVPGQLPLAMRPGQSVNTDDRGHYEMSNLAPGAYRVRVTAQPWYAVGMNRPGGLVRQQTATAQNDLGASLDPSLDVVYATTWFPGADNEEEASTLQLSGGDVRQADFHLNAVTSIHLRVPRPPEAATPAPAIGLGGGPGVGRGGQQPQRMATITRVSADGAVGQVTTIGGNGTGDWDFGGLTPGIYEVRLPGSDGRPDSGEVRQIEVQVGSRVVTLDSAKSLTKVTVKVEGIPDGDFPFVEFIDMQTGRRIVAQENRGGRGGGRGRWGDDNAATTANPAPPPQDRVLTASLPPQRTYAVSVGGGESLYLTGIAATDAKVLGRTVEIGGGSPALTLSVGSGHTELSGTVKDVDRSVEGAMVLLVPIALGQPGDTSAVARVESNSDGSFRFRTVEPGRYIVVALDHGWTAAWTNAQTLAAYLSRGTPMELKAGAKTKLELGAVVP